MTPKQIQGYRNNLKGAVNACTNGATVELDLTTARKLVEVIDSLRAEVDWWKADSAAAWDKCEENRIALLLIDDPVS